MGKFVLGKKNFLICASTLAAMSLYIGSNQLTAQADYNASSATTDTSANVSSSSTSGNTAILNANSASQSVTSVSPDDVSGSTATNTTSADTITSAHHAPIPTPAPATPAASKLTVIKDNDTSVTLKNNLKISTSSNTTLKSVTANGATNASVDNNTGTITITDPTGTESVTAKYGTVGTYNGQPIIAEVTVANMIKHTEDHIAPSNLASNVIQVVFDPHFGGGISTYNIGQDEVTIKFFDASGKQIKVDGDGYLTVGSLNGPSTTTAGNEYVNYDDSANATYVTQNSVVQYKANPLTGTGAAYVGTSSDFTDVLGAPTSENGAVTFQLNGNAFTFLSGTTRYSLKNKNHHWSYALTTFSSATVAPATLPTPILTVDKSSAKAGDTVTYTLTQQVNTLGEDTMLRYTSWHETVTLPSEVTFKSGQLLDSTGNVISNAAVTYDATTRKVTSVLPEDYLQNTMPLNGETYTVKLVTVVNKGVVNGEVGTTNSFVSVANITQTSNNVETAFIAPIPIVPTMVTYEYFILDELEDGTVFNTRYLIGTIGDTYVVHPLDVDGQKLVYLRSSASLTGTFSSETKSIQLVYGLYKVEYPKTGFRLIYDGNHNLTSAVIGLRNDYYLSMQYTTDGIFLKIEDPNGSTVLTKRYVYQQKKYAFCTLNIKGYLCSYDIGNLQLFWDTLTQHDVVSYKKSLSTETQETLLISIIPKSVIIKNPFLLMIKKRVENIILSQFCQLLVNTTIKRLSYHY